MYIYIHMCEISSSGEASAEGLGVLVCLVLLLELLVVLKCSFRKMYTKKTYQEANLS